MAQPGWGRHRGERESASAISDCACEAVSLSSGSCLWTELVVDADADCVVAAAAFGVWGCGSFGLDGDAPEGAHA